jgi:hypothetical protein
MSSVNIQFNGMSSPLTVDEDMSEDAFIQLLEDNGVSNADAVSYASAINADNDDNVSLSELQERANVNTTDGDSTISEVDFSNENTSNNEQLSYQELVDKYAIRGVDFAKKPDGTIDFLFHDGLSAEDKSSIVADLRADGYDVTFSNDLSITRSPQDIQAYLQANFTEISAEDLDSQAEDAIIYSQLVDGVLKHFSLTQEQYSGFETWVQENESPIQPQGQSAAVNPGSEVQSQEQSNANPTSATLDEGDLWLRLIAFSIDGQQVSASQARSDAVGNSSVLGCDYSKTGNTFSLNHGSNWENHRLQGENIKDKLLSLIEVNGSSSGLTPEELQKLRDSANKL